MVTYKVLLDERRIKSDGTYSVIIRITNNRKTCTLNTGASINKVDWDSRNSNVKASYSNAKLLNRKITEMYLKVQKIVLELENEGAFEFIALKEQINNDFKPKSKTIIPSFKEYSEKLVINMLSINKAGNAIIYKTATNQLMIYANNPNLKFTDITFSFLEAFRMDLLKRQLKANSISNYFRTIRAIYNKAIKEKFVERSHYPFLDITVKTERTAKRAINVDQLSSLVKLELKQMSQEWKARSYFLLSFALRGASFTDLAYLRTYNVRRGYLVYKRRKTGKQLTIKLLPCALDIFDCFADNNTRYLLPILPVGITEDSLEAKKVIYQWIKTTNKYLGRIAKACNIEEEITSYVTRHSWATIAKKKLGYSNEIIAECLGHEYGNKITNIYLDNYDQSLIDEANERVINLLNS